MELQRDLGTGNEIGLYWDEDGISVENYSKFELGMDLENNL